MHCHVGRARIVDQPVRQLLREMDRGGVDMAIVCPVDYHIAADNRRGNNSVLYACWAHPDRLRGMAAANPCYGAQADIESIMGGNTESLLRQRGVL